MTGIRATLKWWPLWLILAASAAGFVVLVVTDDSGDAQASRDPAGHRQPRSNWRGQIAVAVPTDTSAPTLVEVATPEHRAPTVIYRAPKYEAIRDLAWSPDGARLAVVVGDPAGSAHVLVMLATGDDVTPVTGGDEVTTSSVAWSPDGKRLAYDLGRTADLVRGTPIVVSRLDGSHRHVVGPPDAFAAAPSWSPDGRTIAYITTQTPGPFTVATGRVKVARVKGGTAPLWLARDYDGHDPAWAPDGTSVVFATSWQGGQGLAMVAPRPNATAYLVFDCSKKLECDAVGRPTFGPGDGGFGFLTSSGQPPRTLISMVPSGRETDSVPVLRLPGYTCCLAWWTPVTGAGQSSV
jgi:dipeptidyl aminopeptidase/acylaminoacyl peptidase